MKKHEHVERRLAAILAADIVGYSRLMGADEIGTLRALKAVRKDLIDPVIAAHGGRIVKTTGDGLLVDFASVVDAVACAVTVQRNMLERNNRVAASRTQAGDPRRQSRLLRQRRPAAPGGLATAAIEDERQRKELDSRRVRNPRQVKIRPNHDVRSVEAAYGGRRGLRA